MIERTHLSLLAALQGIEDASFAASLARPDRGIAAVTRRLGDVETVLRSAVRDLSSDLHDDDEIGGSPLERRALLKLTGAVAGTAMAPLGALDRIASAMEHPDKVDASLLDAYAEVTTTYAEAFYTLPPAQLAGPVREHVDRLVALTRHPTTPALRARLEAMISDAAAFAGMLAYDLDQPGTARASLAMAADAARQAGDATLHALAIAMQARLQVQIAPDDRRAGALLDQAYSTLPEHAPAQARCWIAVHYANDCATTSDELGHQAAIHVARSAAAAEPQPLATGFFSDNGWYRTTTEPHWLDENRARGLVALQHRSAEPLLLQLVDDTTDPRMCANALNSLATLYALRGEVEDACHAALQTLSLATTHGLTSAIRKTRTTRDHLRNRNRNRAVRDLDAALAVA